jgi:eukaryotic-like serine/threonine-protein kinase
VEAAVATPVRIGRYRVLGELGVGGMGALYLARAEGPGGFERLLAIKMLLPHLCRNRSFVDMFLDEARITAMIHHPNVVQTFEVGEHEGQYFIAMDYVSGETLASMLTHTWKVGRPFPVDLGAYVIECAAEGLHAAHELRDRDGRAQGVVHRDVSPQNILVGYDGIVRVVDFGIAKAADRLSHTGTGVRKGKAAYMSPEQIRTEAIDRRADVFSLGVLLWETTVGKRLFKAHNEVATIDRVMRKAIPSPRRVHSDYPRELERIVERALERDRDHRYQSARELADDLRSFLSVRSSMPGPTTLAGLMDAIFPERKRARTALVKQAALDEPATLIRPASEEDEDFLDVDSDVHDERTGFEAPIASLPPPSGVDPIAWLGVAFGVLGLGLALAVVLWFGREEEEEPRATPIRSQIVAPPPVVAPAPSPEPAPPPKIKAKKKSKKAKRRSDLFRADEL